MKAKDLVARPLVTLGPRDFGLTTLPVVIPVTDREQTESAR